MSKLTVIPARKILALIAEAFFFVLYWCITILVFIGEWTQRIIFFPFLMTYRMYKKIVQWFFQFVTVYKNFTPLPEAVLHPPSNEPTITQKLEPFFKQSQHFLLEFLTTVKRYSIAIIKVLIRHTWKGIKATPKYTVIIARYISEILIGFFWNLVEFVRDMYRFFISTYFRFFVYGFIFCLVVLGVYQSYLFIHDLPSPRSIGKLNFAQSTHLYDRNGRLLYEIYRDVNRTSVKMEKLPAYIAQATISIEDKHYYSHKGISFFGGILRAAKDTFKTNELQGGSTITQQLVKSALLSPERTVERKLKEIALALWTEQIYTKQEIMEMYLNQVPYGGSAYGVEEAAKVYFGKSAKNLTLPEAALLAGLPRAPSLYSPFVDKELALTRRNEVLNQMYLEGYISKLQRDASIQSEMVIQPIATNIRAPHFVFYTKNYLEGEYGSKQVEEGGFNVQTTLDLEIQQKADQIMREELEKIKNLNVTNGGMLVIKPSTGEILAMVGSVNYYSDDYGAFNVTTALRQPGSTLKPMLYALALQRGYTAASTIEDTPIIFQSPGGDAYKPVNYDGQFHGKVSLRYALSNSYNIPAVKVLNVLGVQSFVDFGREMGIDSWQDTSRFGLSLSLGGGEVTLLDLAQVYGVFASQGYRVEPSPIRRIVDSKERVVDELQPTKTRVIDEGTAFIISDILSDNIARQQAFGTGSALEIKGHKVAVKTGTTNDKKDNLTIGYTPEYLVAVWVGNNNNAPMHPYLTSGITGAAPIWNKMMKYLIENKSNGIEFERPANIVSKPCYGPGRVEYFIPGTESFGNCYDSVIKSSQAQNR